MCFIIVLLLCFVSHIFWYVLFHRVQSLSKRKIRKRERESTYLIKGLGWWRLTVERFYRLNYTMQTSWICLGFVVVAVTHIIRSQPANVLCSVCSVRSLTAYQDRMLLLSLSLCYRSLSNWVCMYVHWMDLFVWLITNSFHAFDHVHLCIKWFSSNHDDWQLNRISPMNHVSCFD